MCKFAMYVSNRQVAGYMGLFLTLFFLLSSSFAFEVNTTKTLAPVDVHGVVGSFQARYKDLLRGVETFDKKNFSSPESEISFFVSDASVKGAVPPLEIKFETRDSFYDVHVDEAEFFALPDPRYIDFKDSAMLANRVKGTVEVHPIVRTPADGAMITHLRDLRLECEVSWAIQKSAVPLYIRSAFFTAGRVCHSKHIAVSFYSPKPLVSAAMRSGQRIEVFRAGRDGHSYWIPVYDKTWPDDAVIEFKYLD